MSKNVQNFQKCPKFSNFQKCPKCPKFHFFMIFGHNCSCPITRDCFRVYELVLLESCYLSLSFSQKGKECLRWKDAIEGGNGLNGVGIDKIHFSKDKDYSFTKAYLKDWQNQYHERDSLTPERRELVTDYEHRFCR